MEVKDKFLLARRDMSTSHSLRASNRTIIFLNFSKDLEFQNEREERSGNRIKYI